MDEKAGLTELRFMITNNGAAWTELLAQELDPETDVVELDQGWEFHFPMGIRLAQAIHHATDHRSQICTALTSLGLTPPQIEPGLQQGNQPVARDARGRCSAMITIGSVVIRVDDLKRQKAFWTAALDYVPREGDDDDFALFRPRSGIGPNVSLDQHRSELTVPPRIHLDLYADDQAAEVRRLIGLGATEVHWDKRPPDADYIILADPEGNRFCVIDAG